METIKTSQVNELDDEGNYIYNIVIRSHANIKWVFKRDGMFWLQQDKATIEDLEKYVVVIDD